MKPGLLFVFLFVLFVLVGCKLEGESSHTPMISIATYPKLQNGDTLNIYSTASNDAILLDSIHLGDTVSFVFYMTSYGNNLTEVYLTQSSDSSAIFVLPSIASMDSVFSPRSDYAKGQFFMPTGFNTLFFPFKYVATKANSETKFGVRVVSDASFENSISGSNTASLVLKTPIKPKVSSDLEN